MSHHDDFCPLIDGVCTCGPRPGAGYNFPVYTGIEHGQGVGGITGSGLVLDEGTGMMTREWVFHTGTPAVWTVNEDGVRGVFFDSRKIVRKPRGGFEFL
jgi:hypothetical protein